MECRLCGRTADSFLCPSCREALQRESFASLYRQRCPVCGQPVWDPAYGCRFCGRRQLVYGSLHGELRSLVMRYKFDNRRSLAPVLASLLEPLLAAIPGPYTLVPVPASEQGRRRRGFDQSLELCRALHRPYQSLLSLDHKDRKSQKSLHGKQRREISFHLRKPRPDGVIVVVDDIMATGSTMQAAMDALGEPCYGIALCLA